MSSKIAIEAAITVKISLSLRVATFDRIYLFIKSDYPTN